AGLHGARGPGGNGALPAAALGAPWRSTAYAFCVYAGGALRIAAAIPAGGTCGGRPCWRRDGAAFKYADPDATRAGVRGIVLRPGPGHGHLALEGAGAGLDLGPPTPWPLPVDAQLRAGTGSCFGATFPVPR